MSLSEKYYSDELAVLAECPLEEREEVTIVKTIMLSGRTYLGVGTAIYPAEDDDDLPYGADTTVSAREGRFLLIEPRTCSTSNTVDSDGATWRCDILESLATVGPVHDVEVIHGFLAVAAASKVSLCYVPS